MNKNAGNSPKASSGSSLRAFYEDDEEAPSLDTAHGKEPSAPSRGNKSTTAPSVGNKSTRPRREMPIWDLKRTERTWGCCNKVSQVHFVMFSQH